jgi:D-aminopeptidase
MGGLGENSSGDIFLAFSTGNRGLGEGRGDVTPRQVQMLPNDAMSTLFEAVAEATEESILNALCRATTMVGRDDCTAHALPLDLLQAVMRQYGQLQT